MNQVWQVEQQPVEFCLQGNQALLGIRKPGAKCLDFGEQWRDILSLGLRMPDRLGSGIALVAERVDGDLRFLAARFECGKLRQVERKPPPREIRGYALRVGPELPDIKHRRRPVPSVRVPATAHRVGCAPVFPAT